jgi:hypothetical protein
MRSHDSGQMCGATSSRNDHLHASLFRRRREFSRQARRAMG